MTTLSRFALLGMTFALCVPFVLATGCDSDGGGAPSGPALVTLTGTLDAAPRNHEVSTGETHVLVGWMPNVYAENFSDQNFFYVRRSEALLTTDSEQTDGGAAFSLPVYERPNPYHCGPVRGVDGESYELCFGVILVYDHGFEPFRDALCWDDPDVSCYFRPMGVSQDRLLVYTESAIPEGALPEPFSGAALSPGFQLMERVAAAPWDDIHACWAGCFEEHCDDASLAIVCEPHSGCEQECTAPAYESCRVDDCPSPNPSLRPLGEGDDRSVVVHVAGEDEHLPFH